VRRYIQQHGQPWIELDRAAWRNELARRGLPPDAYRFDDGDSRGRVVNRIIAIVGSTKFADPTAEQRVIEIIEARLDYHPKPDALVSGGAAGVDSIAEKLAAQRDLVTIIHRPIAHSWAVPGGYRERNLWIAEDCDYLVRIACHTSSTYGSGYTADRAEALGKPVERITL
jgi:hypothetical protein